MSKIFLYVSSLILLFNNAYTYNTMQYITNNEQYNGVQPIQRTINNTQLVNQQPLHTKRKIVQQDTVNNSKVQQNIQIKNQNNNNTLEQTLSVILDKLSNLENEQEKVLTQIAKQQKKDTQLVQQALDNFYSSHARTLIKPDGNGQIITESDIDPNKLKQYSQEKYSPNSSTLSKTNIISPQ